MVILIMLTGVDDFNTKFNTFFFNLNINIQNYIKNKLNETEIKTLLPSLNNKIYIKNFLSNLDQHF